MQNVVNAFDSPVVKFHIAFLPLVSLAASAGRCRRRLDIVHQIGGALDTGIGQFANFFRVVPVPATTVEIAIEVKDELRVDEVGKSISDVAAVIVVDWQVKEVDTYSVHLTDFLQQHFLRILVWNVPDHYSSSSVLLYLYHLTNTCSGTIRYSLASSPDTIRRFRWQFCLWYRAEG